MSEHDVDAVVERATDATWADGAPVSPRQVRVILTALRPGDRLPGGLVVVPEEPSEAMTDAAHQASIDADEPMGPDFPHINSAIYRAMLAAASEDKP